MDTSARLSPAAFHILLVLAREELHGLGVAQAVDEVTEGSMRLGPGTLYRTLKELRAAGMIDEVDAPETGADPRRRFYQIREVGQAAVRAEAARLARVVEVAREARVLPEVP